MCVCVYIQFYLFNILILSVSDVFNLALYLYGPQGRYNIVPRREYKYVMYLRYELNNKIDKSTIIITSIICFILQSFNLLNLKHFSTFLQ